MPYMVAVAVAGRERDCQRAVKGNGYATYMPVYRHLTVQNGRKIWSERLLFGRYFFARWADACNWRSLMALCHGERPLLSGLFMWPQDEESPERPALVQDREVDRIRAAEDKSGHVSFVPRDKFQKNQAVRASIGVMAGNQGVYVGTGRGGCDVALVTLFGRETRIEFAPGVLQAA